MLRFASLALALTLAACGAGQSAEPADTVPAQKLTVFTGGTIYTGNPDLPTVDAVVVGEDGRIVGTAPPLSEDWDEAEIDLVDLKGSFMYPGFTDSHAHLMGIGQRELNLSLEGTASIAELVTRIESELVGMEPGVLLFGRGWIETGWPEGPHAVGGRPRCRQPGQSGDPHPRRRPRHGGEHRRNGSGRHHR